MTTTPLLRTDAVVELHSGRLKPGTDRERFRRAAAAIMPVLRDVPGFVSREMLYDAERDQWTDVIRWSSRETAVAGAKLVEQHPAAAEFMSLVDFATMTSTMGVPAVLDDAVAAPAQR